MPTPHDTSPSRFVLHDRRPFDFLACDLAFSDPCYGWGDGEAKRHQAFFELDWQSVAVYTVEEKHGTRALVVTDGREPPPALEFALLRGAWIMLNIVGVDSGEMGVYVYRDNTGVLIHKTPTYIGDGEYAVAAWGENGSITALAVLFDPAYIDGD